MPGKKKKGTSTKQQRTNTLLKTLMITGLLLIIVFVAARSFGADTFTALGNAVSAFFSSAGDWNEPYGLNYEDVIDIKPYGSGIVVLTNTETIYLDSSSKVIDRQSHNYKTPAMKVYAGKVLLFDRQSSAFRIEKDSGVLMDSTAEASIITGTIGKRGRYAIAHRADYATSALTVYNSVNEVIFKWNCEKEHIVDVALSDNGKRVAAIVLGAQNGEIYSKLFVFDIRYKDPVKVQQFDGVSLFSVEYKGGKRFLAAGDSILTLVNGDETKELLTFSPYELCSYSAVNKGISALCISRYGNSSDNQISVFDKKGKTLYQVDCDEKVKLVSASSQYVSLLLPDGSITYNCKGEKVADIKPGSDGIKIVQNDSSLYILTRDGIGKYHVPSGSIPEETSESSIAIQSEESAE